LPVEFNASSRALKLLQANGIVSPHEQEGAKKVLDAAALTYVAAMATSLLTLLYFVFRLLDYWRWVDDATRYLGLCMVVRQIRNGQFGWLLLKGGFMPTMLIAIYRLRMTT